MKFLCSLCGHPGMWPARRMLLTSISRQGLSNLYHRSLLSLRQSCSSYNVSLVRGCLNDKVVFPNPSPRLCPVEVSTAEGDSSCFWGRQKWHHKPSRGSESNLYHTDVKKMKQEQKAFRSLIARSFLSHIGSQVTPTHISGKRLFSTTRGNRQQEPNQDEKDEKDEKDDDSPKVPTIAWVVFAVWVSVLIYIGIKLGNADDTTGLNVVSWKSFVYDMVAKGEVEEIVIQPEAEVAVIHLQPGAIIRGRRAPKDMYVLKIVEPFKFENKIRKLEEELGVKNGRGIPISYQRQNSWSVIVVMAIIGCVAFFILRNFVKFKMPNATDMFASERKAKFVRVDQQKDKAISFKDVAGLHEAKIELMEFVDYLKTPHRFKDLGARIPHGALLLGPPGCGKTLLARALASESQVPFLAMAGSDFVEIVGGLGASRVRDLFKEAKKKKPCVIYLDEIDAVGRQRGGAQAGGDGEGEQTLNQLLVEMDGMNTIEGVIVLASTNRPDILDKALLRPGRFDRHIQIDMPTLQERREIFLMYLQKLKLAIAANTYVERLAQLSPGMSGADIANICNEAALHAARDQKSKVDSNDFEYAVERVVAGVAKKSRVLSPQEKTILAYHQAGHAIVGWMLKGTNALLRISIIPRTSNMLGFAQYMPSDQKLHSKEELFDKMCMALGGRAAESLTFNVITSGGQDDINKVTKMAYTQIRHLGFNERVGNISFPVEDQDFYGRTPYSKKLKSIMDEEAQLMVREAYAETVKVITENKEKLRIIAEELLEKETLKYEDIEELIGPPPHGMKGVGQGFGHPHAADEF